MAEKKSYLTFIENAGRNAKGRYMAKYSCVCGVEIVLMRDNVRRKNTKSCGCKKRQLVSEKNKTHGLKEHPLYDIWSNIKRRCYNEDHWAYPLYGGSGITMCDEWRYDFKKFYDWCIENGWKQGLEIDKDIKCGKIYSPDNSLIVTAKENSNSRRNNTIIEFNGMKKTISQWADYIGISQLTISGRIRAGWSVEDTLTKEVLKGSEWNRKKIICSNTGQVFNSLIEAAHETGMSPGSVGLVCNGKKDNVFGFVFKFLN